MRFVASTILGDGLTSWFLITTCCSSTDSLHSSTISPKDYRKLVPYTVSLSASMRMEDARHCTVPVPPQSQMY